jgi:hypothetical protein
MAVPITGTANLPATNDSVIVKALAGYAGIGSYVIRVWSGAGNACLLKEEGTYSTIGDDDYTLPKTAKDMKGCLVELLSTISQIGTINKWKLSVVVSVQGQEDQTFSHDGTFASSGATVTDQIFVQLA